MKLDRATNGSQELIPMPALDAVSRNRRYCGSSCLSFSLSALALPIHRKKSVNADR
jgi:hypothetical protein